MHRGCCGVQLLRAYIAASLPFKTKATWRAMNPQQRFDAVAKYKNVAACSAICLVIFVLVAHSTIKHWPSIPVHHLP